MSKSATTTTKNPSQPQFPSAWAKGPPSRTQSPAPTNPANATHTRQRSSLGQQGVRIRPNSQIIVGTGKPSTVTFGSIDGPVENDPAPSPSVQPSTAPVKPEAVKSFGTVSAGINGKPADSGSNMSAKPPAGTPPAITSASTTVPSTPKMNRVDITKLFQNPPTPTVQTPPEMNSPAVRPSPLPQQQPPPSTQHQQGQPHPPSQQPQLGSHPYSHFAPSGGLRPQNSGPGGAQGSGTPRSPVFQRPMANGTGARPPGGTPVPGAGAPPVPAGLSSPRLTHHPPPPPGQNPGIPQQQMMWQAPQQYYYASPEYMAYYHQWNSHQPHQHQAYPQHPHHPAAAPPHPAMTMSPRAPPAQLQAVPGTPNQAHQSPAPHPTPTHTASNSMSGLSSPPPTPSTTTARLSANAGAFVPGSRVSSTKVVVKSPGGQEVNLSLYGKSGAAAPMPSPPVTTTQFSRPERKPARLESEEMRLKRIADEAEKAKEREMIEKSKKEAVEKIKREKEDQERKEEEMKRKALEDEGRRKKALEEEERKRKAQHEEEEKRRLEEERRRGEEEKLRKEREEQENARKAEEERKHLEEEQQRLEEEEEVRQKKESEERRLREEQEQPEKDLEQENAVEEVETEEVEAAEAEESDTIAEELEEGEIEEPDPNEDLTPVDGRDDSLRDKLKEGLRIDTATPLPSQDIHRKRPGPLNLTQATRSAVSPSLPSALATARNISDLSNVSYPEGITSPKPELNNNAKDGKFRYDRDFLMQFMSVCKDRPDNLPRLDAIGLEPTEQPPYMSRGPGRRSVSGAPPATSSRNQIGLGINTGAGFVAPKVGSMNDFNFGKFQTTQKMTNEERYAMSGRVASSSGVQPTIPFRPAPMVRSASQGGAGASVGGSTGRTRSKRGEKRDRDSGKAGPSTYPQAHGPPMGIGPQGIGLMEHIAPLTQSANAWAPGSVKRQQILEPDSPEIVDRKVKGLLNKLTVDRFDSISDQIIAWANKSEKEKDGRTLIQVIRLVFEKATDEALWSEMYARLCRKMMEQISPKVQDDGIKNTDGKPITGGQLFRKYLLNRCQEDFERGWVAKETTAAAAASKALEDQAVKAAHAEAGEEEVALYSEEYYAAQRAKRQGLGLIKFIGELFKLQMLTERIMHECIKKLLGNVDNPEEEEIESLCKLITTVGSILDSQKARAYIDIYFQRMKDLTKSLNVSPRMQFMLQDVIELRERKWVSRSQIAAPTTIAQVRDLVAKEKTASEKDAYQRQLSMSRGGSRRGTERDNPAGDGWAVAGPQGPARPPTKAGDLSKFGQFIKPAPPANLAPTSVFAAGKKDNKRETASLSRTNSSQNMFSMLSQGGENIVEALVSKASRSPSRKASVDLTQSGVLDGPPQRKKLNLLPRSTPAAEEPTPAPASQATSEDEAGPGDEALNRIREDVKEFFAVRSLDEAEIYFTNLAPGHHFRLVEKLVSSALESKESDAELVENFFGVASTKNLCSPDAFEKGFTPAAENLDDLAIDAPKAFSLMATMLRGAGLDSERRDRIARKLLDPSKLLDLLS